PPPRKPRASASSGARVAPTRTAAAKPIRALRNICCSPFLTMHAGDGGPYIGAGLRRARSNLVNRSDLHRLRNQRREEERRLQSLVHTCAVSFTGCRSAGSPTRKCLPRYAPSATCLGSRRFLQPARAAASQTSASPYLPNLHIARLGDTIGQ